MRIPVELRRSYRLINHGPTTLVTTEFGGRRDVMAAAWVMTLGFEPPRIAAVIAAGTLTRELLDQSRQAVINLPTVSQAAMAYAVGQRSGYDLDKFAEHSIATTPASRVNAPLVEGCAGWLECKAVEESDLEARLGLFVFEVVAAWADDQCFQDGAWRFESDAMRTIHHVAAGRFFATGETIEVPRSVPD